MTEHVQEAARLIVGEDEGTSAMATIVSMSLGMSPRSGRELVRLLTKQTPRPHPPSEVSQQEIQEPIFFGDGGLTSFGRMYRLHQLLNEAADYASGLQQPYRHMSEVTDEDVAFLQAREQEEQENLRKVVSEIARAFGFELKDT